MLRAAFLLLLGTPLDDDAAAALAIAQAQRLHAAAVASPTPIKPVVEDYATMRRRATAEGKPLVVAVNCRPAVLTGVILFLTTDWEWAKTDWGIIQQESGIVVSVPHQGDLSAFGDILPGSSSSQDIERTLTTLRLQLRPKPPEVVFPSFRYIPSRVCTT